MVICAKQYPKRGAEGKAQVIEMAEDVIDFGNASTVEVEELDLEKQEKTEKKGGNRPDFRVVQPDKDQNGNTIYRSVGAMWKSTSKNGNEFYVLKIGELRLLVFKNER